MTSKSSTLKRLKALAKTIPDEPIIRGLLRLIENRHTGSDYAVAIIGASMIERALEVAILSRFVVLTKDQRSRLFAYEQKGPLADFAARSRFGAALGLFGADTFEDLEKIRTIRNLFAHATTLHKFSDEAIAAACADFKVLTFVFREDPAGWPIHTYSPKDNYVTVCIAISGRLRGRLENASEDDAPLIFQMSDRLLP
jgi:hypothetical protein